MKGFRCAALVVAIAATGCASSVAHTPGAHTSTPQSPATTAAPTATSTPAVTTTIADCAAPVTGTALHVVHHFGVSPDDIAVDAAGRLWVTAREANQLISMNPDGTAVTTTAVTGGPEGVAIAGSSVYIAQQNVNAIAEVAPHAGLVIALPNHTANAGVDGIAVGATDQNSAGTGQPQRQARRTLSAAVTTRACDRLAPRTTGLTRQPGRRARSLSPASRRLVSSLWLRMEERRASGTSPISTR